MKILMFFSGRVDTLPPLVTAAACMADLGGRVLIVAPGSADETAVYLRQHGVQLSLEIDGPHPGTRLGRGFLRARMGLRLIREKRAFKPDYIWYHGPFAMEYALIPGINRGTMIIAHAHELCDTEFVLGKITQSVTRLANLVIVPEPNRLWLLKITSKSRASFFCVPNRPLDDALPKVEAEINTRQIFVEMGGAEDCRRFLIYQGAFMQDRCLKEVIQGFRCVPFKDTGLILMGGDVRHPMFGELREIAKGDSRIVFVPRIPFPDHLRITKGCVGGIFLYRPNRLNNVYCAPNKLYEYASLGLGMIFPEYPGLACINREFKIGEMCNPLDINSITKAMVKLLETDPKHWWNSVRTFLDSTATPIEAYTKIYEVLEGIDGKTAEGR